MQCVCANTLEAVKYAFTDEIFSSLSQSELVLRAATSPAALFVSPQFSFCAFVNADTHININIALEIFRLARRHKSLREH